MVEAALAIADRLIFANTGKHLSDLQSTILRKVWQGKRYLDIAREYGCTEGHAKDIGSQLWKLLSQALGERVTKTNFRSVIERRLKSELPTTREVSLELALEPANFVGRSSAIDRLDTLVSQGSKIIVIQGEGGIGKTTLAQQYLQQGEFELILELLMAKETQNITSLESVVEEWLTKDLHEEPGREFGVTLGRLKRHLKNRPIGILIDNLEPALDKDGKLIEPHRRYVELLRVLADRRVESVTVITSRDRLCEPDIAVQHYRLPGLDYLAWKQYFILRQVPSDSETLKLMHQTYGGNAKAMGILCGTIREDFGGDLNAYWQSIGGDPLVETDLKNLVASQFNRLYLLDRQAYQLLCRLGCYRYQDIPAISTTGLLWLLWDVEANKRRYIIASLRHRSLVEFCQGKYWLHPVIQAEAIARLRVSGELETVHHRIAQFWTETVTNIETFSDALSAWEAYYHYLEIQDFELASQVILKSRVNQWGQYLTLGSTLYRMGLLQPLLSGIVQIIERVESRDRQSELYNILGDLYWITGQIRRAIATQEKAIATATQSLSSLKARVENQRTFYYLRMLEVDSLLSIGLYEIDLWELPQAVQLFQKVISLASNTPHYRWAQKASVCLALVHSYLGLRAEALLSADRLYDSIVDDNSGEYTGRFAYFIQILAQTYVNLGQLEKGLEMCNRAIVFSRESHYTQVRAKALTTLAEIYRQQQELNTACSYHREAIELLEQIGAKCDLAQAYFQYGLTWQQMKQISESQNNFKQAVQLFADMEASKQVDKVMQVFS